MLKGKPLARRIRQFALFAILAAVLASCKGNAHSQLYSHGDLYANSPGIIDTVSVGGPVLYMLRNIRENVNYSLRTQIAPGSTVQMDVYVSQAAFDNGEAAISSTAMAYLPPYDTTPEMVFITLSSGDYALVVSGIAASPGFDVIYMQDLRLLSAGQDYLSTLTTSTVDPASYTSGTVAISPGYQQVYSGSSITVPGTYTISLYSTFASATTATISYPQLFVYGDSYGDRELTIRNLLYSVTSNSTEFIFSSFVTSTTTDTNVYSTSTTTTYPVSSAVISNVTFTGNVPFILLKGVAQVDYILTVSP